MQDHSSSPLPAPGEQICYSPVTAAHVTDTTRTRIFEAIRNRELRARKSGRATLIERSELIRWVSQLPVIGEHRAA